MRTDIHRFVISSATQSAEVPLDHSASVSRECLAAPVEVPAQETDGFGPASTRHVSSHGHDTRIQAQVLLALHTCGYEQLRAVRPQCRQGFVVLQGTISTYYLKQVAQEIVCSLAEVRGVVNDLRVRSRR